MKKTLTTLLLATVLTFGATFANAGIIVAGIASNGSGDPCTAQETARDGIIVAGIKGIIVAGFTGIIVAGVEDVIVAGDKEQTCGIIVAG